MEIIHRCIYLINSPDTEDDLSLHIAAWVISEAGEGNVGIVFNSINSYGQSSPGAGFAIQGMGYVIMTLGTINIAYPDDSYGHKNTGVKS